MLGRNKIKYLSSLKIRKYRIKHRQYLMEGEKIVGDILKEGKTFIRQLIATPEWLEENKSALKGRAGEIMESDMTGMGRISSLETVPRVMAVLDMPDTGKIKPEELSGNWTIVLDNIQDPGNLGTIIRTADWFGIGQIICSAGCADCYNPKAAQASMGALLHVRMHYADLPGLIGAIPVSPAYPIYGAFTEGETVYNLPPASNGMIVFGNESRGISSELYPFITTRITIPPGHSGKIHVESLNVASSVAVVCSVISRHRKPGLL